MSFSSPTQPPFRAVSVDERTSSWEAGSPVFRVYLHGLDPEGGVDSTETYDLTGADVLEAIQWAENAAGASRAWALALVSEMVDADGKAASGLIWLVGMDGQDTPWDAQEEVTKSRMLARVGSRFHTPTPSRRPRGMRDEFFAWLIEVGAASSWDGDTVQYRRPGSGLLATVTVSEAEYEKVTADFAAAGRELWGPGVPDDMAVFRLLNLNIEETLQSRTHLAKLRLRDGRFGSWDE